MTDAAAAAGAVGGWPSGVRAGKAVALPAFVLAASFGALASEAGFPAGATIVMSALVHAGSAQFAALGVLMAGGGVAAAVVAVVFMNGRFIPMGLSVAPSLRGARWRRVLEAQAVVDVSWALAGRRDGSFDREFLLGCTAVQYAAWVVGTAVGVALPPFDPRELGLDTVLPAFFLALLARQLDDRLMLAVAVTGAVLALALVPFVPPGVPVAAAAAAAVLGLFARDPR